MSNSTVRLGAVAGTLHHAKGLLAALRIGRDIVIDPDNLEHVKRDPMRMRDLHHHAQALEEYVRELERATIKVDKPPKTHDDECDCPCCHAAR